MSVTIKDNKAKLDKIIKDLQTLEKLEAKIGILDDAGSTFKGERIVDYATIQEFGNKDQGGFVPERSFIRSTADENNHWIKALEQAANQVIDGVETPGLAMTLVSIRARDDIKKKILDGDSKWAPLRESTIKKKGSSKPLIDKGFLINAIKYKISLKD